MMHHPSPTTPPNYLSPSPVRGQLEPSDPTTPNGWRYIQTTDTPNQLRVLLPPGTASMYEQLLKLEALELRKKSSPSWERILEIRHLKDRMIRKCCKVAKTASGMKQVDPFTFHTFVAPSDFRVKEMEKWFHQQQKRFNLSRKSPSGPSSSAHRYIQHGAHMEASSSLQRSLSGFASAPKQPKPSISKHPSASSSLFHDDTFPALAKANSRGGKWTAYPSQPKSGVDKALLPPRRSISSPPPLPHLLRVRNLQTGFDMSQDPQKIMSCSPVTKENESSHHDAQLTIDDKSPSPPPAEPAGGQSQLPRRRSCIKRASTGDLAKTVSWADDRQLVVQLSDSSFVEPSAGGSGTKWEEIKIVCMEQLDGLNKLHQQVGTSMQQLRLEMENLKRVDDTIRAQKEALHATFADIEIKQKKLQTKVREALQDADHTLSVIGMESGNS